MKQKTLFVAAAAAEAKAAAPYAPGSDHVWFSQAIRDVGAERRRHVEVEGFDYAHDDAHIRGEMAAAAACYATNASIASRFEADGSIASDQIEAAHARCEAPPGWPWAWRWWKPRSRRFALVRAAALIMAEIERLDRKGERHVASLIAQRREMLG